MEAFLQQFQHLKIELEEITSATDNFNDNNCIGVGGFGKVYKGELSHSKGRSMAAIKRLDRRYGQGTSEFLKEITMLSRYNHANLISLLGYCYQGDEMILVYEYASRGSLDRHLNSLHLTWTQRLKICLDVAKGLSYLHDPRETHQRLIHCDMKSANILLDDQWSAKLSDFGLSIMGPANEQHSVIVTSAVGTYGYCDPLHAMTHTLTKESDVYSFGVVLFEVLCGTLCCTYNINGLAENFVPTWIESYKQKQLNNITFKNPTIQQLDLGSLEIFSDIAYRCLKESREDRPKMAEVVTKLQNALEGQEFSEWELLFDYEELTKITEPPLNYKSKFELRKLLSKGILVNRSKTWFSLNSKGEHCEMMCFAECILSGLSKLIYNDDTWLSRCYYKSRFASGTYHYKNDNLKIRAKAQFLSTGITYTVNLVFKFRLPGVQTEPRKSIIFQYKLQAETKTSIAYVARKREDGWWTVELHRFTNDKQSVNLEILLKGFSFCYTPIEVEGIEFRPMKKI